LVKEMYDRLKMYGMNNIKLLLIYFYAFVGTIIVYTLDNVGKIIFKRDFL
jgi:hypothetical protein